MVILVLDMLNDFVYGKLKFSKVQKIIPNIKLLLNFARLHDIPIVYCNDSHVLSDRELGIWGTHAMKDTKGSEVINDLKPQDNDYIILKNSYSAFYKTNLPNVLDSLYKGKGVESIIFTGIHTDICVKHSVYDAFLTGYDIIIAENGVAAPSFQKHKSGLDYMKSNYLVQVKQIEKILQDLRKIVKTKRSQNPIK